MIESANQYPVHALLSHEAKVTYQIPTYQREYSWQKAQWEELFQDLVDADGAHFLGTIITLNQTVDAVAGGVLELIDGQQRMTTLTLLLAAIYAVTSEHADELDDDSRTDQVNLGRQLVHYETKQPRVVPQSQGSNRDDYLHVLALAGLKVASTYKPYFPVRRIAKCFDYFKNAIVELAQTRGMTPLEAATAIRTSVQSAILVKIEVASHADAFVLFESLNNRGMPLTPVDLIKNHLLSRSQTNKEMELDEAYSLWSSMLGHLGDTYAHHERFLRQYYNAFKSELPEVTKATVATRTNLIRIYESLLSHDMQATVTRLLAASKVYGRITRIHEPDPSTPLDDSLQALMRAQGAPSYILVMWLLTKQAALQVSDEDVKDVVDHLTSFFVRRNLTGFPQTYALPALFMDIVKTASSSTGEQLVTEAIAALSAASADDDQFRQRLTGPIYDDNADVARFILTALAEDAMTKETHKDLWAQEGGHYVWTIEHILPQGANLPEVWRWMLGGKGEAAKAQEEHVHRLGNLTITAYNSNLGNKGFLDKRERVDSKGHYIGYRNGLSLNATLASRETWTVEAIEERTGQLADEVLKLFPLG